MSRARDRGATAAFLGVVATSLYLNCWNLSVNRLGNTYYSAAVRSMTVSWHNLFFVSFDPGGYISVDKPPVALWVTALSVRGFGYSPWTLLLPDALAASACVAVLWCIVRPRFGTLAAAVSGLALATTPIFVAVARLDLPDPFMVLFLLLASWAVLQSFESRRGWRWVAAAGVLVGLAFNTKMLAAGLAVPAIGLMLLIGTRGGWRRTLGRAAVFGVAAAVVSLSWIVAVDSVDPSSRPYVGGSTDDTVSDLVLGYNGLSRVSGGSTGSSAGPGGRFAGAPPGGAATPGGVGGMNGAGGVMGGTASASRLVADPLGGQIAWLFPLAALGAVAGGWQMRRRRSELAIVALFVGWFVVHAVIFSRAEGTFHSYYTAAMAPAVAGLVGIGVAAALRLGHRHPGWWIALAAAIQTTAVWAVVLSRRAGTFHSWTRGLTLGVSGLALLGLVVVVVANRPRWILGPVLVGLLAALITPTAWALSETDNRVLNATLPQAGPRTGSAGSTFGSTTFDADTKVVDYLKRHRSGERWDLVTVNAQVASDYIASGGLSVMALGGFMGTDAATSTTKIAAQVRRGEVRYFLVSSGGIGRGGPMSGGPATAIMSVVGSVCPVVSSLTSDGNSLFDCAGLGTDLAAAA